MPTLLSKQKKEGNTFKTPNRAEPSIRLAERPAGPLEVIATYAP